jgi:rod shape-determining protein MreC
MRRKSHKPYFLLFIALLAIISLPQHSAQKMQGMTIAAFAPMWQSLASIHSNPQSLNVESKEGISHSTHSLELENQVLRKEIARLKEIVQHDRHLLNQANQFKTKSPNASKRYQSIEKLFKLQLLTIPACVIFRSATAWSSSLWLNVGEANNVEIGSKVIAKNSPVVMGDSVVGVIDYVGLHQSRVRLITDSGLNPSVRVARTSQNTNPQEAIYLAKGELSGSSAPLWRSRGCNLHGIGFNYDFADDEGPARDLRSGLPINSGVDQKAIPILKVKDLLVTTGLDGVFPEGLHVAEVTHVHSLREGDYYYEIEATPTAGNLNELSILYVMPPLGYDVDDQPPPLGN